ncbi:MAG: hypothetical protein MRZ37_04930 [Tenericutes bacterium]|nr:hypothetical protein [Mycoplasmatota bacterium]
MVANGTTWLVFAVILIVSMSLKYMLLYIDSTDVLGGPAQILNVKTVFFF